MTGDVTEGACCDGQGRPVVSVERVGCGPLPRGRQLCRLESFRNQAQSDDLGHSQYVVLRRRLEADCPVPFYGLAGGASTGVRHRAKTQINPIGAVELSKRSELRA